MNQIKDFTEYYLKHPWLIRLTLILAAIILGWMIEKLLFKNLKKIVKRSRWRWDDIILVSLRWIPLVWLICFSFYLMKILTKTDKVLVALLNKTMTVLLIASFTVVIARFLDGMIHLFAEKTKGLMPSTTLFNRTTAIIVYLIGGFLILQNLNIQITPLLTALGVGGLAVALALQDTLGNLFSGIQIIITQQVRPGDYVKLSSGEEGYVMDIKGRSTTIRSFPDENLVIVPNTSMVSSIVTNYNLPYKMMWVSIPCGVHYDSSLPQVESVCLNIAKAVLDQFHEWGVKEEPVVRFTEFADSSINFNVRIPVREFGDAALIKHEFIKRLHDQFNKEGIEIPYPIRNLYFRS